MIERYAYLATFGKKIQEFCAPSLDPLKRVTLKKGPQWLPMNPTFYLKIFLYCKNKDAYKKYDKHSSAKKKRTAQYFLQISQQRKNGSL